MPFDNNQAFDEGWGLFNNGEIQRLDCPSDFGDHLPDEPVFESDEKAIGFVIHQAKRGSSYHQEALSLLDFVDRRFVESWNSDEYNTCKTFETEAEADAFIRGFSLGVVGRNNIDCRVDGKEPNTVLIDFKSPQGYDQYLTSLNDDRHGG